MNKSAFAIAVCCCCCFLPAPPADAQTGGEGTIKVQHNGKTYEIPIDRLSELGREIPAPSEPSAAKTHAASTGSPDAKRPPAEANEPAPIPAAWIVVGLLGAVLAVFGIKHYLWDPRQRRKPLLEALKIVSRHDEENFDQAEELLNQALTAGLRRDDIAEARFALAYIRAQLGRYSDAETGLGELKAIEDPSPEVQYLEMWTATMRKDFEKVESLYNKCEDRDGLEQLLQTRLMAAIAYVKRAQRHWERKEVAPAAHYFHRIRELGELMDVIPAHIEDHQIVLAVQELFQKNFEEARKNFQGTVETSAKDSPAYSKGELGLLLCDWLQEPAQRGELDEPLGELALVLQTRIAEASKELANCDCTHCHQVQIVRAADAGRRVICGRCARYFQVAKTTPWIPPQNKANRPEDAKPDGSEEVGSEDDSWEVDAVDGDAVEESHSEDEGTPTAERPAPLMNEDDVLTRDVLIWRMVSLLHVWMTHAEGQNLAEEDLAELRSRAQSVRGIDKESGHAGLIEGLILYYFGFTDEVLRKAGFELIKQSINEGEVNLAEVHSLVDGENRRAERRAKAAQELIKYIRGYLSNPQVSVEVRKKVHRALVAYAERYNQQLGDVEIMDFDFDNAPTARDMNTRLEGMGNRLAIFLEDNPDVSDEDRENIQLKKEEMDKAGNELRDGAKRFEETEGDVLSVVGQMLLREEE